MARTRPDAEQSEIADPVVLVAREAFGIGYLYPFQRLVIANVLDGVDQIVVLPTGGGKSLCFQVPAFLLKGATLVVMPLLALISDQERALAAKGVAHAVLKGGQSEEEREAIFGSIASGSVRLVLSTPEALLVERTMGGLRGLPISHLVVDEAHCVSEWGETFRPHYLEIHRLHEALAISTVTAFTATASETVIKKIKEHLFGERSPIEVMANPDRPNIYYSVQETLSKSRAVTRIVSEKPKPLLVFARSRKGAERIARALCRRFGYSGVRFYHAGLLAEERKDVEKWFLESTDGVLVSTCAYGMGVDKPNIRTIIHADVPPSCEAYLQESGRAGRDRERSEAILLFSDDDRKFADAIPDQTARLRYRRMLGYALESESCRRASLLGLLDYVLEDACSGCDVCARAASQGLEGEEEILAFVRKNARRYTLKETLFILGGSLSYNVRKYGLDRVSGFGMLRNWEMEDIEEAISRLIEQRKIRLPERGFWKRRLTLGRIRKQR